MAAIAVNSDNFQKVVLESDKPVLVDFWASWCGPCKMLSPVVEELAAAHPEIAVAKVNVDENPELAMVYRISAIPALILFKDGKVAKQSVGYQPREALEELLK
ncbi:MAG: thioredoxin [Eubacteriales bacterium]|nr:thioredoxin [Eubacteriales bacterium]